MKKLMIGAAAAAIAISASAVCSDTKSDCVIWDLSLSLKTLDIKKTSCKDACGDKSTVYYLDSVTRKLTGFLWTCADCDNTDEMNVVLWDTKKKVPVIACPPFLNYDGFTKVAATFADFWVYGKKATKVAASFDLQSESIDVSLAGLNGSIKTGCNDCYIKSLSGNAAGSIALPIQQEYAELDYGGGWCGDKVVETCEDPVDIVVYYTTLCEVCCGFDGWCSDGTEQLAAGDLVPAYGTWKMKYNAKKSKDKKPNGVWDYVPSYAL